MVRKEEERERLEKERATCDPRERKRQIKKKRKIMARTEIGCRVCPCKFVKKKIALYDPNSPLPMHSHCWYQPIAPFDPVHRILQYPFYKYAFRTYPMGDEFFMEKILLNIRPGGFILSNLWLEMYTSDSNTQFCRNTMYDQTKIS